MNTEPSSQNQDQDAKENAPAAPLFRDAPKRPVPERLMRLMLFVMSMASVSGGMVAILAFITFSQNLPEFDSVEQYRPNLVTKVYSTDGRLIGDLEPSVERWCLTNASPNI